MKSEIGLYITVSEIRRKNGLCVTVPEKNKEKIRKRLAFLSLLQLAQQFFFFADSRKS